MNELKTEWKNLWNKLLHRLKNDPYLPAYLVGTVLLVLFQTVCVWDCFHPRFVIAEGALLQALNTGVQIAASMYGLTLTGYIFSSDRLQSSAREEDAMAEVVRVLQQRYHNMILLLTGGLLVAVVTNLGLIYYGAANTLLPDWLWRLLVNEALLLDVAEVVLICYFVVSVADPNKFTRISAKYKARLTGPDAAEGSLQEFLDDYDACEQLLRRLGAKLAAGKRMTTRQMLQTLRKNSQLSVQLYSGFSQVAAYHGCVLFSDDMSVSQEMCALTR